LPTLNDVTDMSASLGFKVQKDSTLQVQRFFLLLCATFNEVEAASLPKQILFMRLGDYLIAFPSKLNSHFVGEVTITNFCVTVDCINQNYRVFQKFVPMFSSLKFH